MLNSAEIAYLRDLAKNVKDLSLTTEKINIIESYKSNNSLRRVKPTVVIFPGKEAQQEYMHDEELRIEDEIFRDIEFTLKWKICKATKLPDDTPVTDIIYTGFSSHVLDWMDGYKTVRIGENLEASHFEPCIIDYDDIKKMRQPELIVDWHKTNDRYDKIYEVFGDIFTVVKGSPFTSSCGWGES